jgi:O-antigen/teichoic acid export membrane protein
VGSSGLGTEVHDTPAAEEPVHFRTDHLLDNLKNRAISGGFITVSAQGAKFVLNFTAAAVLARLLSPTDFGLVGMVLGITSLAAVFGALGLSTATIQRETITQKQVSNLFWINVATSGILSVLCAASAPLVAEFYRNPRVTNIMLAMSITFLLTGSTVQHQALLTRQMRFRALAVIDVTSAAIGFACACLIAWKGYAYWGLVAQQLVTTSCSLALTWLTSGWRPQLPSRNSGVKPMVRFGAHLSAADFLAQLSMNTDTILLGRFYGAAPLGLYTRANVLLTRPIQQVMMPINSVLIPVLSRLQFDPERYRRTHMRAYDTLLFIVLSFAAMCFVLSRPLVLVILGPKWTSVVPLFAGFTFVAVTGPPAYVCTWVYESQGRGGDQLRNHTILGVAIIIAYLVGLPWGPMGIIVSVAIYSVVFRMPVAYYIAGRTGPVRTRDYWSSILSHLPCWGALFVATYVPYRFVQNAAPLVQLLICVPIGIVGGGALILLFRRPRESAFYAWNIFRRKFTGRFATS